MGEGDKERTESVEEIDRREAVAVSVGNEGGTDLVEELTDRREVVAVSVGNEERTDLVEEIDGGVADNGNEKEID